MASTQPILDFASIRKPFAVVALFSVPIFIGIGFGVQAVDVVNESSNAIFWFAGSAILAAILVLVWEEIVAIPGWWHRLGMTILLELFIINLFYQGSGWAARKGSEASFQSMKEVADRSKTEGFYTKWLRSQGQPQPSSSDSHPIRPAPKPKPPAKPDLVAALIYPEDFALLLINQSSALLNKPKWGYAIWDLDRLDDHGQPTVLPIPTMEGDWIRPHEALGPESAIGQVEGLIKPGDRLLAILAFCVPSA
jgi:hypothetical protein